MVTRSAAKRGKEKVPNLEVEEIAPLKHRHRTSPVSTTPVVDVHLKHGDDPIATLLSKICTAAPPPKITSGWSTNQVREKIARNLM